MAVGHGVSHRPGLSLVGCDTCDLRRIHPALAELAKREGQSGTTTRLGGLESRGHTDEERVSTLRNQSTEVDIN